MNHFCTFISALGDGWDVAIVNSDEEMFDIIEGNKKLQHADNPYWLGGTTQMNHGENLVAVENMFSFVPGTPVEFPDATVFSMTNKYSTDEASKYPEYLIFVELGDDKSSSLPMLPQHLA